MLLLTQLTDQRGHWEIFFFRLHLQYHIHTVYSTIRTLPTSSRVVAFIIHLFYRILPLRIFPLFFSSSSI